MIEMMTPVQQEEARQFRLNEPGTMPPCPLCGRPRVERSCYIRCNPCGLNWENDSDWTVHPRTKDTASTSAPGSASTAKHTSERATIPIEGSTDRL